MVLISKGNSEIGVQVRSDFGFMICLGHFFRSKAVKNLKHFSKNICFRSHVRKMF